MRKGTLFLLVSTLASVLAMVSLHDILGRPGEAWLPESEVDKLVVLRE